MNTTLRHIVARTYKPLLTKYLSKTRVYRYNGINIDIAPQVFHPGFFFSTRLLLQYCLKIPLNEKTFLELGCGSGLISIVAAKKGAKVTATDINPVAVEFLKNNCARNGVSLQVIQSDLFQTIPQQKFDIIAINPPYYKNKPVTNADYAWFCGENGEYFSALFDTLADHIHKDTEILMVLFDGCDMQMITWFASMNGFVLNCIHSKQNVLEKNHIFKIVKR